MTQQVIEDACAKMRAQMAGSMLLKDTFSVTIPTKVVLPPTERPTVIVSLLADRKMQALVQLCDKEIGWHGTVSYDPECNAYTIEDIFVFPQEITGTTVQSIDEEYGLWLSEFSDEAFNKLRLHGHSHVNMGTTPSGTDDNYQQTLLADIEDFYIFLILNKKNEYNIFLYDIAHNAMYDKTDIDYDTEIIETFAWAKNMMDENVSERKIVPTLEMKLVNNVSTPVISAYREGFIYNYDAKGYVPKSEADLKKFLDECDALSRKGRRGRKPKNGTYEQYQRERVTQIDAAKNKKAQDSCDGRCLTCKNTTCEWHEYRM